MEQQKILDQENEGVNSKKKTYRDISNMYNRFYRSSFYNPYDFF